MKKISVPKKLSHWLVSLVLIVIALTSLSQFRESRSNNDSSAESWLTQFIDPVPRVSPGQVYTFHCEMITRVPKTLTNTCADFGELVSGITWSEWEITGATGEGTYSINDCSPSCAKGNIKSSKVLLKLDGVTTDGKRYFLNTLTIISEKVVEDGLYRIWDLSSFYREVPGMRTDVK